MADDGLDIPPFLKLTPTQRREGWKGVKLTKPKIKKTDYTLPKNVEPEAKALFKQIEADKAAAKKARFAALRLRASKK